MLLGAIDKRALFKQRPRFRSNSEQRTLREWKPARSLSVVLNEHATTGHWVARALTCSSRGALIRQIGQIKRTTRTMADAWLTRTMRVTRFYRSPVHPYHAMSRRSDRRSRGKGNDLHTEKEKRA